MSKGMIAGVCITLGVFSYLTAKTFSDRNYHSLYCQAHTQAITQFGDKKIPMMVAERDEWYGSMGVSNGKMPSRHQLKKFLEENLEKTDFDRK
jgi:hypothetical protein